MSDHEKHTSDEEGGMKYIQAHLAPLKASAKLQNASLKKFFEEDEESRYFMSEPSISDYDLESSFHPSEMLSPPGSLSDASSHHQSAPLPPPNQPPTVLSSPGNTSLSSRDNSPRMDRKTIQMQFMQDKRSRLKIESTPFGPVLVARPRVEGSIIKEETGTSSTSSASIGQQLRAAAFLSDLKLQSIGAVQDADTGDFDSVPAAAAERSEIDAVMRRQQQEQPQLDHGDSTIVMTLSDDSGGDNDLEPLDWEQQNSADDEHTQERPRRVRKTLSGNSKSSQKNGHPGHRRTRSGDGAAANLMTGGIDWKGMQQDMLPMPEGDDDDETENESKDAIPHIRQTGSSGASSRPRAVKQNRSHPIPTLETSIAGSPGSFSMGSCESSNQNMNRRSRRFRQQSMPNLFAGSPKVSLRKNSHNDYVNNSHFYSPQQQGRRGGTAPTPHPFGMYPDGVEPDGGWQGTGFRYPLGQTQSSDNNPFLSQMNASFSVGDGNREDLYQSRPQPDIHQPLPEFVGRQGQFQRQVSEGSHISGLSREDTFSCISAKESQTQDDEETIESEWRRMNYAFQETLEDSDDADRHIAVNRLETRIRDPGRLGSMERLFEDKGFRGKGQTMMRSKGPKFSNKAMFKPVTSADAKGNPTFVCPQCGLKQRSFFTANSAPTQVQGPAGYLALYFGLYVLASLYIFGLQEGWKALDCVYFAVITLTTAGLGDLVPTSDSAKVVCSVFIYFGVACIGLLLGTYLAGMMDEGSQAMAMESRVDSCVNCSRVRLVKQRQMASMMQKGRGGNTRKPTRPIFQSEKSTVSTDAHHFFQSERATVATDTNEHMERERADKRRKHQHDIDSQSSTPPVRTSGPVLADVVYSMNPPMSTNDSLGSSDANLSNLGVIDEYNAKAGMNLSPPSPPRACPPTTRPSYMGSPMTTQILGRQRHTRHHSFDVGNNANLFSFNPGAEGRRTSLSARKPINESVRPIDNNTLHGSFSNNMNYGHTQSGEYSFTGDDGYDSVASSSDSVMSAVDDPDSTNGKVKTAKYVFLTLKQALMNSTVIIAVGSLGFYCIENMSMVDSFYFTTVLLTTVGYGDIYPVTDGGKLFATIYVLVAGTVLLNNMSLISMIPLELRKRRIQKAVLSQFGDQLDDAALEELATGPLVQRLQLSSARSDGLAECTREMFALAMLVRLGKVTERDVRQTFAAFRRLDVDKEGVLNSRTIITGMMNKKKSMKDLASLAGMPSNTTQPSAPPLFEQPRNVNEGWSTTEGDWFGNHPETFHVSPDERAPRFPSRVEQNGHHPNGENAALLGGGFRQSYAGGTFEDNGDGRFQF